MELNKLYCIDNIEGMKQIEDNYIDLTVTSPPYDKLRNYNGYSFDFENVAKQLFRITKNGGVNVWVVGDSTKNGNESGTSFRQALYFKEIGFNLHDTMIYQKINYIPLTHNRYEQEFEYMFIFTKGKLKTFNPIMIDCKFSGVVRNSRTFYQTNDQNIPTLGHKMGLVKDKKIKGNVWEFTTNSGTKGHPAQFPERLAEDHIFTWSNENDIIFDPFVGSGTTCKMAKQMNRRYLGFDCSQEYIDSANKRIDEI